MELLFFITNSVELYRLNFHATKLFTCFHLIKTTGFVGGIAALDTNHLSSRPAFCWFRIYPKGARPTEP